MAKKLVKRTIFDLISQHLEEPEITVIIGARQVGKTTLLYQLKDYLLGVKGVLEKDIHIFNLDLVTERELFSDQDNFIRYLRNRIQEGRLLYIFVDEVQRIPNPGLFFKGVYDLGLTVKFVLTGSSSLEIKSKIHESLTGRKQLFFLTSFSFVEFLRAKDESLLSVLARAEIDSYHHSQVMQYLFEYFTYGGYPRVVIEERMERKIQILKEIYSSYIEKDIIGFLKIKDSLSFSKLVSILASQIGKLVNVSELSITLGVKQTTVKNYLSALEQTFIIHLLRPFYKNVRKEITKMPKVYFLDIGLRNFALEAFKQFEKRGDKGEILENFVFTELARKEFLKLRFWRTKDKSEVDFIVEHPYEVFTPFEIKAQKLVRPEIPRGMRNFIKKYKPQKAYVVNLGLHQTYNILIDFIFPYGIIGLFK